jgi:uncharacterized protein (DUF427 family)
MVPQLPTLVSFPLMLNVLRIEPSPRWIRVFHGGALAADSRRTRLLLRPGRFAVLLFPLADIKGRLVPCAPAVTEPNPRHFPGTHCELEAPPDCWWDLQLPGHTLPQAVWGYRSPPAAALDLNGHVGLVWQAFHRWMEEDEPLLGHPRSPFHRVDLLASSRHVTVGDDHDPVAETRTPLAVFETGLPACFYVPRAAIRQDRLVPSNTSTCCVYKGKASYWHVRLGNRLVADAAWAYENPLPAVAGLAGHTAFMNSLLPVTVDGERQQSLW